jgi:hypothetical protein
VSKSHIEKFAEFAVSSPWRACPHGPARIEIEARGTTFVGERSYPKRSPSPDPSTFMTNDEVVTKFLDNAEGMISSDAAEWVADRVMNLEEVDDFSSVLDRLRPAAS